MNIKKDPRTNSNIGLGTCSQLDRFARTGNKAPVIEPTSIMNTEPILRPKDESSPPPEPQETASDIARVWGKCSTQLAYMWGYCGGSHLKDLKGDPLKRKNTTRPLANIDHVIRILSTLTVVVKIGKVRKDTSPKVDQGCAINRCLKTGFESLTLTTLYRFVDL